MTDFKERVAEFYEEARQLQDQHSQLASYYRTVAIKAKMLGDSLNNLEQAQKLYEQRREVFGLVKEVRKEVRKEQPVCVGCGGWDDGYSDFET